MKHETICFCVSPLKASALLKEYWHMVCYSDSKLGPTFGFLNVDNQKKAEAQALAKKRTAENIASGMGLF